MLTLFYHYKDAGKLSDALLIGRNLCNRNPANKEMFSAYYDFICFLAETLPSFADRQNFAEQASIALAFFSENVELDESFIGEISTYQERLATIFTALGETERIQAEAAVKETQSHHSDCLKRLYQLKDTLKKSSTQKQFDETLFAIGVVDSEINKDTLNEEQSKIYDTLTKECTDLISTKMRNFESKRNIDYNKQAADSYAKAFRQFRNDESKYKNQTQLFNLASTTLFAYDSSRLFNETLIYYNHVYAYIFSKLDDDGKLAMTRYSIECERKLG